MKSITQILLIRCYILGQNTNLRIAMKTSNTIQRLLMMTLKAYDKFTRSGAYKLTCPDCPKAYVVQTARSFLERFNEHKILFKTNRHTFNYAKHILEKSHSFGPIHNRMEILQYHGKGTHLNTTILHICRIHQKQPPERRTQHIHQQDV